MLETIAMGVAAAALGAAVLARRGRARLASELAALRERLEESERQQALMQQSISGLTAGAVGMDRRMRRVEATEKWLSERQETMENQQAAEQPYHQAIRLVQQGATARRLVEELSLSESEADLLVRLHGLRDSA